MATFLCESFFFPADPGSVDLDRFLRVRLRLPVVEVEMEESSPVMDAVEEAAPSK